MRRYATRRALTSVLGRAYVVVIAVWLWSTPAATPRLAGDLHRDPFAPGRMASSSDLVVASRALIHRSSETTD